MKKIQSHIEGQAKVLSAQVQALIEQNKAKKWYGHIGYDNEGITCEKEFKTEAEAKAYERGAMDMQEQCDNGVPEGEFSPLEDYWTAASDIKSRCE